MESEFEPAVLTEESPEARIVLVHLPGFNLEDLGVHFNNQGNLIIVGQGDVKEMGEITKVEGRLEKMQSGEHGFRKVISVPENVNRDDITVTLKDRVVRVNLPFIQKNQKSLAEDVNGGGKLQAADPLEQSKPDERSSPVKEHEISLMQERLAAAARHDENARVRESIRSLVDSRAKAIAAAEESRADKAPRMQERLAAARHDESARLPDVIRSPADYKVKAKASAAAEESKADKAQRTQERLAGPRHDESARLPDVIRSPVDYKVKTKASAAAEESKADKAQRMQERLAGARHDESARLPDVIRSPVDYKVKTKASAAAEESKADKAPKHAQDFAHGEPATISPKAHSDRDQSEILQRKPKPGKKKGHIYLPLSNYEFPERRIQVPSSPGSSMFCSQGLLIASTVLVSGVYMYLSYILSHQNADRKP